MGTYKERVNPFTVENKMQSFTLHANPYLAREECLHDFSSTYGVIWKNAICPVA